MWDSSFIAVLLDFVLYAIFVLLPLVPAVIIYKKFPGADVSIEGTPENIGGLFKGLTIKAKGAFAAYIVTVLLGFFLIQNAQQHIDDYKGYSKVLAEMQTKLEDLERNHKWKARSQVKFVDINNREITGSEQSDLLERLKVTIDPPMTNKNQRYVTVSLPALEETTVVEYSALGYITQSKAPPDAERIDSSKHELIFGIITLLPEGATYVYDQGSNQAFMDEDSTDVGPLSDQETAALPSQ